MPEQTLSSSQLWMILAALAAVVIALVIWRTRAKRKAHDLQAPPPSPPKLEEKRPPPPPVARKTGPKEQKEPGEARPKQDEAARKAAYQERKEAERAERQRRREEEAAAEEARRAEAARAEAEREAEARRLEEERQRKIAAEAGRTLKDGLARTREGGFMARLAGLLGGAAGEISDQTIGELEEILFTADIGVKTSMRLVEGAQDRLRKKELASPEKLRASIRSDIEGILAKARASDDRPLFRDVGLPLDEAKRPWVIMVVGVNGAGKTTTIGKLAAKLEAEGKRTILAAGDTFRAGATEQLDVWAERAKVPLVKGADGADPGSVLFDAVQRGVREDFDVVICDTAGRLHTKASLMEELKKVQRVIGKAREGAPDEILLVLDATMGQNAIQQARQFHDALGVTGIVLTKLDGTAKGGVVIGISDELEIPVRLVGVGESLADLRPFHPKEYVDALFGS